MPTKKAAHFNPIGIYKSIAVNYPDSLIVRSVRESYLEDRSSF